MSPAEAHAVNTLLARVAAPATPRAPYPDIDDVIDAATLLAGRAQRALGGGGFDPEIAALAVGIALTDQSSGRPDHAEVDG